MLNQAALDLAKVIEKRGWTHAQVEAEVGLAEGGGLITKMLHGDRKPSRPLAFLFETKLGIPMSHWEIAVPPSKAPRRRPRRASVRGAA